MSKRDDVSKYYDCNTNVQKIISWSFVINIIGAILTLFSTGVVFHCLIILQIIASLINVILSWTSDFIIFPMAEKVRRKTLLDNSFNINTTIDETEGYYNNDLSPSVNKLILNSFESIYFTFNLSKKMIPREFLKSLCALIVLIIALNTFTDNELPLIVFQVVFSSSYVLGITNLILYCIRLNNLYNDFYQKLFTDENYSDTTSIYLISLCAEYEIIKGSQRVKIPINLFKKWNPEFTAEWENLKMKSIFYKNY